MAGPAEPDHVKNGVSSALVTRVEAAFGRLPPQLSDGVALARPFFPHAAIAVGFFLFGRAFGKRPLQPLNLHHSSTVDEELADAHVEACRARVAELSCNFLAPCGKTSSSEALTSQEASVRLDQAAEALDALSRCAEAERKSAAIKLEKCEMRNAALQRQLVEARNSSKR